MACQFQDSDWADAFRGLDRTSAPLLEDWVTAIQLAEPPSSDDDECAQLVQDIRLRKERNAEILRQAVNVRQAVQPVQNVMGPWYLPLKPATKGLVDDLLANLIGPVFHFKVKYMRGRPGRCCPASPPLDPMFPKGTLYYPGHPAYPSGHSTQAHAVALLCAELAPAKKADLLAAADRVAQNREIAGLHYPSDSAAGASLAAQALALFLQNPGVKSRLPAAQAEWPVVSAPPSQPAQKGSSPRPAPSPETPTTAAAGSAAGTTGVRSTARPAAR
jgi:hypothetical protein